VPADDRSVRRRLGVCLAAALASGLVAAAPAAAARVEKLGGEVYGVAKVAGGKADLLLDLYRPARKAKRRRPVVIAIHGGGFAAQSRTDPGIVRTARALAARGVVVASIDYRLMPQRPVPSRRVAPLVDALPKVPLFNAMATAVDDTLTAIDYLRANARRFRIDVRRLGLVGSSAGAITADHVAYTLDDHGIRRPKVRFVGSLWGGIFVPPPAGRGSVSAVQLERGEAALFAVHGDTDRRVPAVVSDQLAARARAQRVRHEYHRIAGAGHGFGDSEFFTREVAPGQTSLDRLLRFARSAL
jgi:acetyl esterase/lipase